MKITRVVPNNRKKAFEVYTRGKSYDFPYAEVTPTPTTENKVDARVDQEMSKDGFAVDP